MIIAFSGWRNWADPQFIAADADRLLGAMAMFGRNGDPIHIRVGDADGADRVIRLHLDGLDGIASLTIYKADWEQYGRAAGPFRNAAMLSGGRRDDPNRDVPADLLVAYPEPGVRRRPGSGTWQCIEVAAKNGIEVRIPAYRPSEAQLERAS